MLNMNIMSFNELPKSASSSLQPYKGEIVFWQKGFMSDLAEFVLEMSCGQVVNTVQVNSGIRFVRDDLQEILGRSELGCHDHHARDTAG